MWYRNDQLVRIVSLVWDNNPSLSLTFRRYANCAWIPVLIAFVTITGVCGKAFVNAPVARGTAAQIFNFGATIGGNTLTWGVVSSDYTAYFHPSASRLVELHNDIFSRLTLYTTSWRIFTYSYLGINLPTVRDASARLVTPLTAYRSLSNA